MKLLDKTLLHLLKQKRQLSYSEMTLDQLNGLILNKMNLGSISLNMNLLKNIQLLSLENNFLSNIDFILQLPHIYYLDIAKNSIEDLQPLNVKSTFGYLKFTLGQFVEKRLLLLKGMTIGILDIDIIDNSLFKQFLTNSPNIIVLNNQIIYFYDTFLQKESIRNTSKHRSLMIKSTTMTMKDSSNALLKHKRTALPDNHPSSLQMHFKDDKDSDDNDQHHKTSSNLAEINQLNSFFEYYNRSLHSIVTNMSNPITSTFLSIEEQYIDLERKKLKVLASILNHINQLVSNKERFLIFRERDQANDVKAFDFDKLKIDNIQKQLIIFVLLILKMTQVISSSVAIEIVNYLLIHFCKAKYDELPDQNSWSCNYILSLYYNLYDGLMDRNNKAKEESSIQIKEDSQFNNYKWIVRGLKMNPLVLKGNYINELNSKRNINTKAEGSSVADRPSIKSKMNILTNLQLTEEILPLIQFLSDFVHLNKLDKVLTEDSLNDYASLNELKEYLYHSSSAKLSLSLSDKKYQHLKLSHLSNRHFLSKDHITHKSKVKRDEDAIRTAKKIAEIKEDDDDRDNINTNHSNNLKTTNLLYKPKKKKPPITTRQEIDALQTDFISLSKSDLKLKPDQKLNDELLLHQNQTNNQIRNDSIIYSYHNKPSKISSNHPIKLSKDALLKNYAENNIAGQKGEKILNNFSHGITEALNSPKNHNPKNIKSFSLQHHHELISTTKDSSRKEIQMKRNYIKDINNLTEIKTSFVSSSNCFTNKHPILFQSKAKRTSNRNKESIETFMSRKELKSLFSINKYRSNPSNMN